MRHCNLVLATLAVLGLLSTFPDRADARDQIRIVGSSTVYPLTSKVAERFNQTSGFAGPIIEATGTEAGFGLFCAGVGAGHPDITAASWPMSAAQFDRCQQNGVEEIVEIPIGYDGVLFASARTGPTFNLTREVLFQAVSKEVEVSGRIAANPYTRWSDIDPNLPPYAITVRAPTRGSGTRKAFEQLVMSVGCEAFPAIAALDSARKSAVCSTVREDGAVVETSEDYSSLARRLAENEGALGVLPFAFLEEAPQLQAASIDGVEAGYDTIAAFKYPVSRRLFLYVKLAHLGVIPGLLQFIQEFTSENAYGPEGYLNDTGLVSLPDRERAATALTPMARPAS